jgi:hypothetical protein
VNRAEYDLLRRLAVVEAQLAQIDTGIRRLKKRRRGPPRPRPKPVTPEESDAMIRAWRSGETYQAIGERYGLGRERIRLICFRREREERLALDAKLIDEQLGVPPQGRLLYGQEYEFTADDPEIPVVRVPRGVQTQRAGGYIQYKKA